MTTTSGIYSMKDMYTAVATVLPKLQEVCRICNDFDSDNTTQSETTCQVCGTLGWLPTRDLQNIIMNINYNFTLVLQHDMIGWMAKVTLDDEAKDWLDYERPVYGDPITAVYAALYRAITKSSRTPGDTPSKVALNTNFDVSH